MVNIEEMSMGAYKKRLRDDVGQGLVQPAVPATATFELKGHILTALKDISFYGKDHEDAFKHLDKVNDINDYFNVLNVNRDTVLLRMLPVTFKGAAKDWLKALPLGTITTWAQMCEQFLDQFCPPSKIAKLKKAIANFEQNLGESLYEAWERYKGLLRNCPQHDLNIQQEVSIFYEGVNVMTRQLLDSQGPLTKKNAGEVKELVEEFAKHSREYHNPRNEGVKGVGSAHSEEMLAIVAMLNNTDRRLTQMDQSIHAVRVGCERCSGPHFTKDCHLDEYGNKKAQVCYSSGDKFNEDWRKPKKEWLPYDEYKRQKEEKYKQTCRGFYQKEQPPAEKKVDLENMLTRFMEASERRHDDINAVLKEHMNMMKEQHKMMIDQQASLRNNQESIHSLEVQVGQLTTLFLEALEVEPKQPDPKPKKPKLENEESTEIPSSRRESAMHTSWARSEQKNSISVPTYKPPLPFPSRSHLSPLERVHLEFIQQIKEYAKLLQDIIDTRHELKKNYKVILSEQSLRAVLGELPKKMGDPGRLTLPCAFGNNLKTYALSDSWASINLMPFSFYQKLNIQKMKATKMTIHMANRSVIHPRGIVEDILVKIGKFVFPVDFVIMDMKEDANILIILGRPLLNTVGALVDVRESKLTLRDGDDKEDFGIQYGFQGYDVKGEVFNIDEENELEELEKLTEEEIKAINQVKHTKPSASVPFFVEVIAYTKPTSLITEESDEMSSDEEEVTSKVTSPVVKEEKDTMELKCEDKLETKGIKRKLDGDAIKAKKEILKKAYIRQVQAYKRRFKEKKIQLVMDSSDDST
ncbi:uncharacterized protein LOC111909226 [Lactuca sativa]|uniref:uncharacterized protein LOC111909226 n=1 Tax=Lactuca sativa TaxID=4236 RepID=UPI000CD88E9B|nr:uncharacterized protein LOC111909226 [Lactuca sativa]